MPESSARIMLIMLRCLVDGEGGREEGVVVVEEEEEARRSSA